MGEQMTVETGNTDTIKPDVLIGLDAPDRVVLRVGAALYIHGWVFSSDADVDALYVECNGVRYGTTYPVKRPELGIAKGRWINAAAVFPQPPHAHDLSRDSDAPYDFGFVSSAIDLKSADDKIVEITVIAEVRGQEQHLVTRQIQILRSDPECDFFNYGKLGAFKHPVDFKTDNIIPVGNHAPVFLVGCESQIQQMSLALKERGVAVSAPIFFSQMLATIEACYDVYSEYDFLYFSGLRAQFGEYGISKIDIYALLNRIIAHFHQQSLRSDAGGRFFALSGERDVGLIPLLKVIYPNAVFVHVDEANQSVAIEENGVLQEDDIARKMRILRSGNAQVDFHHISVGEPVSVSHAVEKILQFAKPVEPGPRVEENAATELRQGHCESYLQALPVLGEQRPIFILGAGRSGTSAMTGALKVSGIAGFHEGHVLPMMDEMARRLWESVVWDSTADDVARAGTVRLVIQTCFDQAYGDMGSLIWLDKTADHVMIHCVPLLTAMFPNARFLFLTRHPIAVAESRRRKFGETPYFSMLEWKKCVIAWDERKHLLKKSSYLECDAKELRCKHLHQQVSAFLEFDAQRSETLSDYLTTQSPEMTRQMPLQSLQDHYSGLNDHRSSDFKSLLLSLLETLETHIEDTDWDSSTIAWVKRFLGTLPDQFGYTLHRSESTLVGVMANFSKLMEEQKHLAEVNEQSMAVLQDKYATQTANAHYWKEQHDCQLANATKWKERYQNDVLHKSEKTYRKWINGILGRS